MILFANKAACHLVDSMNLPPALYTVKRFSDGELYIKIDEDIQNKKIWIIAGTQSPAENLLELFFLLDAIARAGAQNINLFFSYFGYARQATPAPGEASSVELICDILKKFPLAQTFIMHAHDPATLHKFLDFTNVIDIDFFCDVAKNYDAIAAPDEGAIELAQQLSQECNKEAIFIKKTRPAPEEVKIESVDGDVANKKILLVDDMISTGRTIIEAANALKNLGATSISAAATHGIFAGDAAERIEKSCLEKIYVTNTIKQKSNRNIQVYDIGPFIENIIQSN